MTHPVATLRKQVIFMRATYWIAKLFSTSQATYLRRPSRAQRTESCRPFLETLEDPTAPAVFNQLVNPAT